jgi:glycosyltransferase involved in cell wall biosynthesis
VRVALDAQLTVGTATGIGEYVRGLAAALRRRNLDLVELRDERLNPWRFDRRVLWDQFVLPRRAGESRANLLHCASGTVPRATRLPIVVTVHDVAWLDVQSHAPPYARYYFGPFSLRGYRRAKRIVVDSEFSRGALLKRLNGFDPAWVGVVYPGVAAEFVNVARERGDGRTILSVGTIEPRKNLELLVRALPKLPGARLVAVGPHTPYARECAALAERLNVADRLEMPGYVVRDRLVALYTSCAVVAVPSLYEGFGYAAAQALCAGVPCVVSDRTSLPEVSGGDAPVVALEDLDAWCAQLAAAFRGDLDSRAAQVRTRSASRFSWDAAADSMMAIYGDALEESSQ